MRRLVAKKIPCARQQHNREHINVALVILLTSYLTTVGCACNDSLSK